MLQDIVEEHEVEVVRGQLVDQIRDVADEDSVQDSLRPFSCGLNELDAPDLACPVLFQSVAEVAVGATDLENRGDILRNEPQHFITRALVVAVGLGVQIRTHLR